MPKNKILFKKIRRLRSGSNGFMVAIDDGYCAYKFHLNIYSSYSIMSLAHKIQNFVKKDRKLKNAQDKKR